MLPNVRIFLRLWSLIKKISCFNARRPLLRCRHPSTLAQEGHERVVSRGTLHLQSPMKIKNFRFSSELYRQSVAVTWTQVSLRSWLVSEGIPTHEKINHSVSLVARREPDARIVIGFMTKMLDGAMLLCESDPKPLH